MGMTVKGRSIDTTNGQTNSAGTPSLTPYPPNIVSGDIFIALCGCKYPTDTDPVDPTGFTFITNAKGVGGVTASPTPLGDRGATTSKAWYRIADATESGNVSVTLNGAQSGRMLAAWLLHISKPDGTPSIAACNGGLTVPATSISVPMGTDPGFKAGDLIIFFITVNSDTANAISAGNVTVPGCVVGGWNHYSDFWTAGQDALTYVGWAWILSGESSGAPTFTATSSGKTDESAPGAGDGTPEGGVIILRIRDVYGSPISFTVAG